MPEREQEQGLKILVSNRSAGSLLGPGGRCLQELRAVTECKIYISEKSYPHTDLRCCYIIGTEAAVSTCHCIALSLLAKIQSMMPVITATTNIVWEHDVDNVEMYRDVPLEIKIAVPLQCARVIFGENGNTIRGIRRLSGVDQASMVRDDPASRATHEKVITVRGTTLQCIIFTEQINRIMAQNRSVSSYVFGSNFSSSALGMYGRERPNRGDFKQNPMGELGGNHGSGSGSGGGGGGSGCGGGVMHHDARQQGASRGNSRSPRLEDSLGSTDTIDSGYSSFENSEWDNTSNMVQLESLPAINIGNHQSQDFAAGAGREFDLGPPSLANPNNPSAMVGMEDQSGGSSGRSGRSVGNGGNGGGGGGFPNSTWDFAGFATSLQAAPPLPTPPNSADSGGNLSPANQSTAIRQMPHVVQIEVTNATIMVTDVDDSSITLLQEGLVNAIKTLFQVDVLILARSEAFIAGYTRVHLIGSVESTAAAFNFIRSQF